tara:strand:- start:6491 stop:6769 length:279 start_codon:yes stop_codon:yes gene_type:complete
VLFLCIIKESTTKGALMQLRQIASNMTQLDLANGTSVLFSYRTPVACLSDNGYYRTSKYWSVTTSRHINKWLGGVLAKEQPQEFFNGLCNDF